MDPVHLSAPRLLAAGFAHGFSLAPWSFGVEVEGEAHATLARAVGYDPSALRCCKQVHGARVRVDAPVEGCGEAEADALALVAASGAVAVRTADCASILLGDRDSGAVAAVHAGWRGVVAGVIPAAVRAVGGRGPGLMAALGPCIGPCCFEVGEEVEAAISAACGVEVSRPGPRGRPHVDLAGAVIAQLEALGIQGVERVGGCTVCSATSWHSFRRDGPRSGRMLAVITAPHRRA